MLLQWHQGASGAAACGTACISQQQQGQQAMHLRLRAGRWRAQQLLQQPCQADGLVSQVAGQGCMALVEHQVDHPQHAGQPGWPFGGARHFVGDARGADLGLGAHDALGQGGRGHQAGGGDGLGAQPADLTQGQRNARLFRQAGVAAGEDQAQAVILDDAVCIGQLLPAGCGVCQGFGLRGGIVPGHQAPVTAQPVNGLEAPG